MNIVSPVPVSPTDGVSWLRLLVGGEETYSGSAGTIDMSIELDPNYTGSTRSASIMITSGSTDIEIIVTQNGKKEDGTVPEDPNPGPGEPDADYFGTWLLTGSGDYEGVWESATIAADRLVFRNSTAGDVYTLEDLTWTAVALPEDANGDGVIDANDDTGYSAGYKITGTLAANPAGRSLARAEGTGYADVGEQVADWWYIKSAGKDALIQAMWAEPAPGSYSTRITGPFAKHTGELPPPTPAPVVRLIDRMGQVAGEDIEYIELDYDAQNQYRIKSYTYLGETVTTTNYTYPDANTVVVSDEDGDITLTLNNEGYVVKSSEPDEPDQTYTYADGYLQKIETVTTTYVEEYDGYGQSVGMVEHSGTLTATYTWENGNIKKMVEEKVFPTAPEQNAIITDNYEYGTTLNKPASVDLGFFGYDFTWGMGRGWMGKSTADLPSKIATVTEGADGSITEQRATGLRYETDAQGYVTAMYSRVNDGAEEPAYMFTYK